MTLSQRLRAIKRLRMAAERAIGKPETVSRMDYRMGFTDGVVSSLAFVGVKRSKSSPYASLENAWRAFPECERDETVPSPQAIVEICERMEREQAEDEAFAERMKAR